MISVSALNSIPASYFSNNNTGRMQGRGGTSAYQQFSREELELIGRLKRRDREVRAHEQAHRAAAGPYASSPSYTYQRGPDGKNYAIGGEVQIDTSPVPGDPEATLRKAEIIRSAANAPANPSAQDRSVAAEATAMAIKARMELARQQQDEMENLTAANNADEVNNAAQQRLENALAVDAEKSQNLLDLVI